MSGGEITIMREKYGYGDNCRRNRESERTGAYRSRKRSLPSPNLPNKGDTTYGLADVYRSVVPARSWRSASGLDDLAGRVVAVPGTWLANTRTWWGSGSPVEFRGRRQQRWGGARWSEKRKNHVGTFGARP